MKLTLRTFSLPVLTGLAIASTGAGLFAQTPPQGAILKQYCLGCHNNSLKTASFSVQGLDAAHVDQDAATWEKVLRRVKIGQMPPGGLPRPKPEVSAEFTGWLEGQLDGLAASRPNPGRPTIHRLNRAEYSNAVRDLLALDIKPGSKLPADDTGYGFDNIGDVLSLSPVLIERYMAVGRTVSKLAVGNADPKPDTTDYEMPRPARNFRSERLNDEVPFDSTGGLSVQHTFPADGQYALRIKMPGAGTKPFEERIPVKAGVHTVAVTFLAENTLPEIVPTFGFQNPNQGGRGGGGGANVPRMDLRIDGVRVKLFTTGAQRFQGLTIEGPFVTQGAGDSPSRQKIFVCKPTGTKDQDACAKQIFASLARRAYRRPITDADVKPLLALYQMGKVDAGFDVGIETALRGLLVSPNFLFRVERDPAGVKPGGVYRVNQFELASRMSFFLWSSIPDDELLGLAEKGRLSDPTVVSEQVTRMLDDRRSKSFVSNFAGQWLFLRTLAQVKPDPDAFPKFDDSLRKAFEKETELFFDTVLREDRPVTDLLSADFTYLNQRLAEHYGVAGVYGSQFRRVTLKDQNRGGLLGQGSILTVTSYPNRTSVVQRGKWVLENLLGTPPPAPPADIPALEAHSKDGKQLTMRQQMEQHRANPVCASCHSRMDPIGFSLENYDGVGAFRTKDAGNPIDVTGKMPDGKTFEGPAGLKSLLLNGHRDEFLDTFTEKLMTYALGRGVESFDQPAIRAILRDAGKRNTSIPDIINAIVLSPQFQTRKTREL